VFNARTDVREAGKKRFEISSRFSGVHFLANQNESLTPAGSADRLDGSGICCNAGSTIDPAILLHFAVCSSQAYGAKKERLTSTGESCHSVRQESLPISILRSLSE
jgi:hypothetical protein